jgi:hypothetical protein
MCKTHVLGVPVDPRRLLSTDPGFMQRVRGGEIAGFMAADTLHPATQWIVVVGSVHYLTPSKRLAEMLFKTEQGATK